MLQDKFGTGADSRLTNIWDPVIQDKLGTRDGSRVTNIRVPVLQVSLRTRANLPLIYVRAPFVRSLFNNFLKDASTTAIPLGTVNLPVYKRKLS